MAGGVILKDSSSVLAFTMTIAETPAAAVKGDGWLYDINALVYRLCRAWDCHFERV